MEFCEKLQQLRKQHHLTQEQLAQQLYVSRTAVSKWESGRGYPNLQSLKDLSRLFAISIDELLSNHELMELAESENRSNLNRMSCLVFSVLDLLTIVLLVMPLLGQQEGESIRTVTLLAHVKQGGALQFLHGAALIMLPVIGVFAMILNFTGSERGMQLCKLCSLALHAGIILLFSLSRLPYLTALLFLQFLVKVALVIQENRVK